MLIAVLPVMRITFATALVLVAACAESPSSDPKEARGTVYIDEQSETRIAGSYVLGEDTLEFEAHALEAENYAITLTLHGLTLEATLETNGYSRVWTQDGFTTADGSDTMMVVEDVQFILQFVRALEADQPDISAGTGLAHHFDSVVNYWAMWIPAMSLTQMKFEVADRATSLCSAAQDAWGRYVSNLTATSQMKFLDGAYNWAGHDCGASWLGGSNCNGDPLQGGGKNKCSARVQLGDHSLLGYPASYTWYSTDSYNWTTAAYSHSSAYAFELGECYGRYGVGCGSGHSYNQESLSHDQCVRNGHNVASSWCSDELTRVADTGNCY